MKKDWGLETKIAKAIDALNTAQRELYSNPEFCIKLLITAEDTIHSAFIRMIERAGDIIKGSKEL